jgi:hypothetical protein
MSLISRGSVFFQGGGQRPLQMDNHRSAIFERPRTLFGQGLNRIEKPVEIERKIFKK